METITAFEDFLDRMQGLLDNAKKQGHIIVRVEDLENAFPELAESDDERIRNEIISALKFANHKGVYDKHIAWLEKQEEKPVEEYNITGISSGHATGKLREIIKDIESEKVEAKFKVGDEIKTGNEESLTITKIDEKGYWSEDLFICSFEDSAKWELVGRLVDKIEPKFHEGDWIVRDGKTLQISHIDKVLDGTFHYWFTKGTWLSSAKMEDARLWNIQDAKEGAVLAEDSCIFIIEKMNPNGTAIVHCTLFNDGEFHDGETLHFDIDSTHPATKEQRDLLFSKMKEAGYEWDAEKKEPKKIEQKPTDEEMKEALRTEYEKGRADTIAEMQNHTWSEEDEKMLHTIIADFKGFKHDNTSTLESHFNECIDWLKSLKYRVQPKVELTQVDKVILEAAIAFVEHNNHFNCWRGVDKHTVLSALHSLRPQNQWKPSDEQIEALIWQVSNTYQGSWQYKASKELLEQLKKLRDK